MTRIWNFLVKRIRRLSLIYIGKIQLSEKKFHLVVEKMTKKW
jgi:hypothetical protein